MNPIKYIFERLCPCLTHKGLRNKDYIMINCIQCNDIIKTSPELPIKILCQKCLNEKPVKKEK